METNETNTGQTTNTSSESESKQNEIRTNLRKSEIIDDSGKFILESITVEGGSATSNGKVYTTTEEFDGEAFLTTYTITDDGSVQVEQIGPEYKSTIESRDNKVTYLGKVTRTGGPGVYQLTYEQRIFKDANSSATTLST